MKIHKFSAILATAAVAAGSGLGIAQAQTGDGTSSTTTTTQHDRPAPGKRGGPGKGMRAADLKALAAKLDVTVAKLKAAMDAARPAGPAAGEKRGPGDMAADLATALGVETAAVQKILDANRPEKPAAGESHAPGTKPDHSKLISALASGLNIDEATVKAAFTKLDAAREAEHEARHTAMAAAIAKELGLSTEKVQAALEATRPPMPARP